MKIAILKVPEILQPDKQPFKYPGHNKDYGVEQDFLIWLKKNPSLLTKDPNEADWHYLPVYWTRWHMNHAFGEDSNALSYLREHVESSIQNDEKTFTITQFDGGTLLNLGKTVEFTAARTSNSGIDIPILCSPHRTPIFPIRKKHLASFNGSFYTHPLREEMRTRFESNKNVLLEGTVPTRFYKRLIQGKQYNLNTLASYIALSPRGTSCNSFRFFEAMQLGVAPMLIGDYDARPFKKFLPWDEFSFFAENINDVEKLLKDLNKTQAVIMGKKAYSYWKNELYYQKWCKYVIKELNEL